MACFLHKGTGRFAWLLEVFGCVGSQKHKLNKKKHSKIFRTSKTRASSFMAMLFGPMSKPRKPSGTPAAAGRSVFAEENPLGFLFWFFVDGVFMVFGFCLFILFFGFWFFGTSYLPFC